MCNCIRNLLGILSKCEPVLAGMRDLYLTYASSIQPVVDLETKTVSKFYIYDSEVWYHYAFAKNSASLSSSMKKENGVPIYSHQIEFNVNGLSQDNNLEIMELAKHKLVALVIDNSGKKWFVGYDGALINTSDSFGTGANVGDRNGYTLSFQASSAYLPLLFTGDIVTDTIPTESPVVAKSLSIIPNPAYVYGNSTSVMVTLKYTGRNGDTLRAVYDDPNLLVGDIIFTGDTATVMIYFPANNGDSTITYNVDFVGNGVSETLVINQSNQDDPTPIPGPGPTPPTPDHYLTVSPQSVTFPASGGTQTITITSDENWSIN